MEGTRRVKKKAYSIYYSGGKRSGLRGTGFYVEKEVRESVLSFEPDLSDRICKLKLKGKFQNITIISIYAPMEDDEEEEKDKFYDDLTEICCRTSRHDITLILGDYNAKIGREPVIGRVADKYSLHDCSSENGIRVCDFAASQDMWISSVSFQHKDIHKQTWKIPGERGANHIDPCGQETRNFCTGR